MRRVNFNTYIYNMKVFLFYLLRLSARRFFILTATILLATSCLGDDGECSHREAPDINRAEFTTDNNQSAGRNE